MKLFCRVYSIWVKYIYKYNSRYRGWGLKNYKITRNFPILDFFVECINEERIGDSFNMNHTKYNFVSIVARTICRRNLEKN